MVRYDVYVIGGNQVVKIQTSWLWFIGELLFVLNQLELPVDITFCDILQTRPFFPRPSSALWWRCRADRVWIRGGWNHGYHSQTGTLLRSLSFELSAVVCFYSVRCRTSVSDLRGWPGNVSFTCQTIVHYRQLTVISTVSFRKIHVWKGLRLKSGK